MKRSTPLRRTGRLPRRAPLRAKGGARFPKRRDPGYCRWIRTLMCCVRDQWAWIDGGRPCQGRTECAHVVSRAAGGYDVANTVPLCTRHHRESHAIGRRSFEARYRIDLEMKALYYGVKQPPKIERDFPDVFPATHDQDDAGR